jgi:hypothetical protein
MSNEPVKKDNLALCCLDPIVTQLPMLQGTYNPNCTQTQDYYSLRRDDPPPSRWENGAAADLRPRDASRASLLLSAEAKLLLLQVDGSIVCAMKNLTRHIITRDPREASRPSWCSTLVSTALYTPRDSLADDGTRLANTSLALFVLVVKSSADCLVISLYNLISYVAFFE